MNDWINVKDRLPEQYKNVLVGDQENIWVAYLHKCDDTKIWWAFNPDYKSKFWNENFPASPYLTVSLPTYWMPLPSLPRENE